MVKNLRSTGGNTQEYSYQQKRQSGFHREAKKKPCVKNYEKSRYRLMETNFTLQF